ncbi:MerR family transcriptional regulator [Corynebacterium freneyi]
MRDTDDGAPLMKIGEVAERTSLSIRSLRHYDEMGLASPSAYSPGGFRLYTEADVERLLTIRRMKPLGFPLERMREFARAVDALYDDPSDAKAAAVVESVRVETAERLRKLRKHLAYAEEFADIVDEVSTRFTAPPAP